jgi:hypothetical protein
MKIAGSGSISQRHGSADPDPLQNVMDPQHCLLLTKCDVCILRAGARRNVEPAVDCA